MSDVPDNASPSVDFVEGAIYAFFEGGSLQLRRFIVADDKFGELVFKDVSTKWDRTQRNAVAIPREKIDRLIKLKKLVSELDYIRPDFMTEDDNGLKLRSPKTLKARGNIELTDEERAAKVNDWLAKRDDDFGVIEPLVGDAANSDRKALLLKAYSPRHCSHHVADYAREHGLELTALKRLLHKYAWFGLDRNALLQLDAFKGKSGVLARINARKPGPKDAAVRVYGEKYQNRPRAPSDLPRILAALKEYWVKRHMTLVDTYEAMKERYYKKTNQHGEAPIQDALVPTPRMFEYAARKLIQKFGLRALREGPKGGAEFAERRGHDTDISPNVASVFDIDGTPFNRELVSRFKVEGKRVNIGKPYVVLVFSRTSKKCVGWHVYIGNENWKEGYRLAIFCALTSKRQRLKWLGIDAPDAWPDEENIRPSFVYVDGGAGASNDGRAAMERLLIDFHKAPPDAPYWKPTVESGLGRQQSMQSHLDGGYERTNNSVEKDARRIAKLHAGSTLWAFERLLVKNIIKYNNTVQKDMRLPAELKERFGPARTPHGYHSAGIASLGGVEHRRIPDAEVYRHLLSKKAVFATLDGVRLFRSRYRSEVLRSLVQASGNLTITVLYDPLRLERLFWLSPDGALVELVQDDASRQENGRASAHDQIAWEEAMRASEIRSKRRPPKKAKNQLTRRQRDIAMSTTGDPRQPQRKTPSKGQELARSHEAAVDLRTRTYDQPDVVAAPPTVVFAPEAVGSRGSVRPATPTGRGKILAERAANLASVNRFDDEE